MYIWYLIYWSVCTFYTCQTFHMTHMHVNQSWISSSPKLWLLYINSDLFYVVRNPTYRDTLSSICLIHNSLKEWFEKRMNSPFNKENHSVLGTLRCESIVSCEQLLEEDQHQLKIKVPNLFSINITFYNFHSPDSTYYQCKVFVLFEEPNHSNVYTRYCGHLLHTWSIYSLGNQPIIKSIFADKHKVYSLFATYHIMDQGRLLTIERKSPVDMLDYMKSIIPVLETTTDIIYHYLIQTYKIYHLKLQVKTVFYGAVYVYDGPGSQSPLLAEIHTPQYSMLFFSMLSSF